jgi:hypothetical protein
MHGAWRELLRIAEEGCQAQEILPLHLLQKSLATGFLEIPQGDAVSDPGFSLPAKLNLFEEVFYCGADTQTGIILDGIRDDETRCERIQLSLLANAAVVSSGCVSAN